MHSLVTIYCYQIQINLKWKIRKKCQFQLCCQIRKYIEFKKIYFSWLSQFSRWSAIISKGTPFAQYLAMDLEKKHRTVVKVEARCNHRLIHTISRPILRDYVYANAKVIRNLFECKFHTGVISEQV